MPPHSVLHRWLPGAAQLPGFLAACSVSLVACASEVKPSAPVERVLLITCDTLRADRLGAYGYAHPTTPHLDRFAKKSLVFDRAYSTAPMTTPAVSAIFTGRLPDELGVMNNKVQIAPAAISMTEVISRAGIRTAAVLSNWVLARRGLEEAGLQQGFDHYDDTMTTREANRGHMFERDAAATTDAALAWVKRQQDRRFFLWVHYQDPHGPYTPPEDCLSALQRPLTAEPKLRVGQNQRGLGELPRYQAIGEERSPEAYRIRYDAEIRFFDREVGRLLDGLEKRTLLENMLVVITADHGESLGERNFWFSHGQHLFDELVRVPFIVRYPRGCARPSSAEDRGYRRVDRLVSHLDIMPTILDAFGLKGPQGYGQSLLRAELPEHRMVAHMGAGWFGVTDARHRCFSSRSSTHLYDVEKDPLETRNLAERDGTRVEEMLGRFEILKRGLATVKLEGVAVNRDSAEFEALKALGYAGVDEDSGRNEEPGG